MKTELTLEAVKDALSFIPPDDREMWVKMGMALKDEYGDDAKDAWLDWSSGALNYDAAAAGDVWKSCKASGKVTIGSLIYEAKQFGWKPKRTDSVQVTPEDYARKQAERDRRRAEEDAHNRDRAERAATRAVDLWNSAQPATSHPYLTRKNIQSHGARVIPVWERKTTDQSTGEIITVSVLNVLVIPMYSGPRTISSLQFIFAGHSPELDRDRDFLPGGTKQGSYYTIGSISKATLRVIVAEGFATGASIHEATGCPVFVAFDAGNLAAVANSIRAKLADVEIIIAGDNDLWTKGNPGARKANAAAHQVHGRFALPIFADYTGEPTDFNDLRDAAEIKAQIETAINPQDPEHYSPDCRWQPPTEPQPAVGADCVSKNTGSASPTDTFPVGDGAVPEKTPSQAVPPAASDGAHDDDNDGVSPGYFTILGYDHDRYFVFQHERKQLAVYTAGSFTDSGFIALAPLMFWETEFPSEKSGFSKKSALNWFIRTAHRRGIFDPSHTRGRGAWVDRGRVVLHMGNTLVVDGVETPITDFKSRYVYELDRSLPTLSPDALTSEEGEELLALAMAFRWAKPASGPMLAGWCAMAGLCGALRWRPHVWLTGGAGCGKAVSNDSPILTPNGWTTMGDIKLGDIVSTPDNGYAVVKGVYPQGVIPVYKVTFADGRSVRACADHLWKVRVKDTWRIRNTSEMIEMLSRGTRQSRSLAIPLCEPMTIRGNKKIELPIHPYVLGAILGDGSVSQNTITFTCTDEEMVERIRKLSPPGIELVKTCEASTIGFRFRGKSEVGQSMRSLIKELSLFGTLSENKYIPRAYLDASIEDRIELLKGLMDTDGTASTGAGVSYCTISECLRDGVVELVQSLGGIATVGEKITSYTLKGEKRTGKLAYNISIRLKDPTIAFSLQRKLDRVRADHQYSECLYLNVKSIELDGEDECTCIQVDHPDRLFVTKEFIVTHNTTILNDYIHPLMNGMDIFAQGNSTEAGIRQTLRQDALPVLFDESEKNNDRERQRVDGVLALIRQSSTESAARTLKGSAGGEAMQFHIRSMFCLSSIQVGLEKQADYERMAVLALRPKRDGDDKDQAANWVKLKDRLYATIERDEDLPARLFRRSLNLLPITLQNIEIFATQAAEKFGSQRDGDQYGTLIAGAWSLISDQVATPEQAREMLDSYEWAEFMEYAEADESMRALHAVLEAKIRVQGGIEISVHEIVQLACNRHVEGFDISSALADGILQRNGMRVKDDLLLFSNRSPALLELMRGGMFESDLRGHLLRVPGATRFNNATIKIGPSVGKCVAIPIKLVLPEDTPAAADDPDAPPF